MISVALPIGPRKSDRRYLTECLESLRDQTVPFELVVVSDMAKVDYDDFVKYKFHDWMIYHMPWRVGCADAWNIGISVAKYSLVFMMSADDTLHPRCLEACLDTYLSTKDVMGYYYVKVQYSNGEEQDLPCNAAMVTKRLWQYTGGFTPEMGVGAPDCAFISTLIGNPSVATIYRVNSPYPLYYARQHSDQDTGTRGPWQGVILETRDILTRTWRQPEWGRYR